MEASIPIYSFDLFGFNIGITMELLIQWVVMLIIIGVAYWSTKDLKERSVSKKQTIVEMIYEFIRSQIDQNMGKKYRNYIPIIGSLAIYLLLLNLVGLFGLQPPTQNLSVAIGFALISFLLVQGNAIYEHGIGGYFKGYVSPMPVMLPLNILERVSLPLSLSLRLFGNMFAATVIMELIYEQLSHIFAPLQIGLPIVAHAYFDIFDGGIQMIIFIMLTMVNIKVTAEH